MIQSLRPFLDPFLGLGAPIYLLAATLVLLLGLRKTRKLRGLGTAMFAFLAALLVSFGASAVALRIGDSGTPSPTVRQFEIAGASRLIGAEDLAVVRFPQAAILVSSTDRSAGSTDDGALYLIRADDPGVTPVPLRIERRDSCSFRPHGIDIYEEGEAAWVFAINHHSPSDWDSAAACTILVSEPGDLDSVERFRLDAKKGVLRFEERIFAPEDRGLNDLAAVSRTEFVVTSPIMGEGERARSRAMLFDRRSKEPCQGRVLRWSEGGWKTAVDGLCYPNGIAIVDEQIWVSTSLGGGLHRFRSDVAGTQSVSVELLGAGVPDNIWRGEDGSLLVTAHASARRFLVAAKSALLGGPPSRSAWCVARVNPARFGSETSIGFGCPPLAPGNLEAEFLAESDGHRFSAASSAVCLGDDLFVGQVFGRGIARIRNGCSLVSTPETVASAS